MERILKIFFIFTLFIIPFGQITRFQLDNGLTLIFNDIVVGLLVLLWLVTKLIQGKKLNFKKSFLFKPLLIFISISFISLIINSRFLEFSQFIVSFFYLLRWVVYAGVFFIVSDFNLDFKRKIPFLLLISSSVLLLGGYIQFFFYPYLRNLYYLGWDDHLYRMFTSFFDPNFSGAFFTLNLILILGLLINSKKEKRIIDFSLVTLLVITLGGIILSFSRSTIIMFIFSLGIFFVLQKKKKILLGFVLILLFSTFFVSRFFKSESSNIFRTTSSIARIDSSIKALVIIRDNPIVGVGFNAYKYAQNRYGFSNDNNWQIDHSGAGTDNSFLFVFATTGIIGLISYLYLWIKILNNGFRNFHQKNEFKKMISLVLIAAITGIFVNSFFINSLFYIFIMEWLWIIAGLNSFNTMESK